MALGSAPVLSLRYSTAMDRHGPREIQIFNRFARAAGLTVDETSIEKRNPPEPDILCRVNGVAQAFELVEIIDQDHAQRVYSQVKLKSKFETDYEALEASRREKIYDRVGNALIYVVFNDAATFREKEEAVNSVFEALETVAPQFEGRLRQQDLASLSAAIRLLWVSRRDASGPLFDVEAVGSLGDPTVDAIPQRFAKVYTTHHPVELLAYYELQPELPEALWRPSLKAFLAGVSAWPFRRVWVYDCGSNTVRLSAGPPA